VLPSGPTSATSSGHAGLDDGNVRAAVARGDEGASSSSFVAVIVCVEEVKRTLLFLPILLHRSIRLFSLSFSQE
jgi:hypothetical protein